MNEALGNKRALVGLLPNDSTARLNIVGLSGFDAKGRQRVTVIVRTKPARTVARWGGLRGPTCEQTIVE